MSPLKTTKWLEENISKVKILDATWHMPNSNRNAIKEYEQNHIKSSIFFDLDKNSNQKISLPHMLPDIQNWEKIVSRLGIKNDDHIIVYDNSEVLSASRCWFTFLYFGHDVNLISVLDGGLKKWKLENKPLVNTKTTIHKTNYVAKENKKMVKTKFEIDKNISFKEFEVIDARSLERFEGRVPEPRSNLKSGSIEGSSCIPFNQLINKNDNTFKSKDEINRIFKKNINTNNNNIVFSCGSGVTASVLALAYSLINTKYTPTIYDGSWSEYGLIK